jgi:hypothetical protein
MTSLFPLYAGFVVFSCFPGFWLRSYLVGRFVFLLSSVFIGGDDGLLFVKEVIDKVIA